MIMLQAGNGSLINWKIEEKLSRYVAYNVTMREILEGHGLART